MPQHAVVPPRPTSVHRPRQPGAPGPHLPEGERKVLTAAAQYDGGVDREQLTILTTFKRSTRNTYVQRMASAGYLEIRGDRIVATPAGLEALGADFEPLPTGDRLRAYWLERLPEGERQVLEVVLGAYPKAMDRELIDGPTEFKRSTRNTYLQRLGARKLIRTERGGMVRAADELFG